MTAAVEWFGGYEVSEEMRKGLQAYTHIIRGPGDPQRSPRPKGGRKDKSPHFTLRRKSTQAECEEMILGHIGAGVECTFNAVCVTVWDWTADMAFRTRVDDALWALVERGELEHTWEAPVLFRRRKL